MHATNHRNDSPFICNTLHSLKEQATLTMLSREPTLCDDNGE